MRRSGAALLVGCLLASPVVARQEKVEDDAKVAAPADVKAPRRAVLAGRVLLKDGVTPFSRAEIVFTDTTAEERFEGTTARSGRYKVKLPVGTYNVLIIRGMEIYSSPSEYRVSAGVRNEIDFLVIPDFEESDAAGSPGPSVRHGPGPAPSGPAEVGSIVDIVHEHAGGHWRRWAETLGFIGSLLLVAIASGG